MPESHSRSATEQSTANSVYFIISIGNVWNMYFMNKRQHQKQKKRSNIQNTSDQVTCLPDVRSLTWC